MIWSPLLKNLYNVFFIHFDIGLWLVKMNNKLAYLASSRSFLIVFFLLCFRLGIGAIVIVSAITLCRYSLPVIRMLCSCHNFCSFPVETRNILWFFLPESKSLIRFADIFICNSIISTVGTLVCWCPVSYTHLLSWIQGWQDY